MMMNNFAGFNITGQLVKLIQNEKGYYTAYIKNKNLKTGITNVIMASVDESLIPLINESKFESHLFGGKIFLAPSKIDGLVFVNLKIYDMEKVTPFTQNVSNFFRLVVKSSNIEVDGEYENRSFVYNDFNKNDIRFIPKTSKKIKHLLLSEIPDGTSMVLKGVVTSNITIDDFDTNTASNLFNTLIVHSFDTKCDTLLPYGTGMN